MSENGKIQLYEDQTIRTAWDEEQEEWYFSVADVVSALTGSPNQQTCWLVLKKRLTGEGNETVTNRNAFKMKAAAVRAFGLNDCLRNCASEIPSRTTTRTA